MPALAGDGALGGLPRAELGGVLGEFAALLDDLMPGVRGDLALLGDTSGGGRAAFIDDIFDRVCSLHLRVVTYEVDPT